ncbi:MAG: hypothetical protein JW869_03440 [Candidatus Omnitrophica bacterium]|nr:hypothetical protein [Candidatus Omnitrophota bacterium]
MTELLIKYPFLILLVGFLFSAIAYLVVFLLTKATKMKIPIRVLVAVAVMLGSGVGGFFALRLMKSDLSGILLVFGVVGSLIYISLGLALISMDRSARSWTIKWVFFAAAWTSASFIFQGNYPIVTAETLLRLAIVYFCLTNEEGFR